MSLKYQNLSRRVWGEVMNLFDLYECDSDFRGLMDLWVNTQVCPIPLPDLLVERGFPLEAEGAQWALENNSYPELWRESYYWWEKPYYDNWVTESVPSKVMHFLTNIEEHFSGYRRYDHPLTACLDLLRAWSLALSSGADLPRFLAGVK